MSLPWRVGEAEGGRAGAGGGTVGRWGGGRVRVRVGLRGVGVGADHLALAKPWGRGELLLGGMHHLGREPKLACSVETSVLLSGRMRVRHSASWGEGVRRKG